MLNVLVVRVMQQLRVTKFCSLIFSENKKLEYFNFTKPNYTCCFGRMTEHGVHTVDTKTVTPPLFTIGSHSKRFMQKLFCWFPWQNFSSKCDANILFMT